MKKEVHYALWGDGQSPSFIRSEFRLRYTAQEKIFMQVSATGTFNLGTHAG